MTSRRRLTFQLTPLLDLLLIVIFAQYMEVQQTAQSGEAGLQARRAALETELQQREQKFREQFALENSDLEATRRRYSEQFQSIVKQHRQAAMTLAAAFNLPGRVVEQALKLRTAGANDDAERIEQAGRRIQELLKSREKELLQFLVRFDEMQKHVSIWELHVQDNGLARFTDGEHSRQIPFETAEEFARQCFEASKSFTEPHPLVLILMTWGDTQAGIRRRATEGLPLLVDRLRHDAAGTRWFDFSLMGFRPEGPLLDPSAVKTPSAERSPSRDTQRP